VENDIERMIRELTERRRLAEQAPAPLGAFLAEWFIAQQDCELRKLQEAPGTET
jgi:hypothetical protein